MVSPWLDLFMTRNQLGTGMMRDSEPLGTVGIMRDWLDGSNAQNAEFQIEHNYRTEPTVLLQWSTKFTLIEWDKVK